MAMSKFRASVRRSSVFAVAVLVAACAGPTDPSETQLPVQRLSQNQYSFASYSDLRKPERLVISSQAAWADLWEKIHHQSPERPAVPVIDFTRETVVAAALGDEGRGRYVFVTGAVRRGGVITVSLEIKTPGPGCAVPAVITQPVDLATVPRVAPVVEFEEKQTVFSCG